MSMGGRQQDTADNLATLRNAMADVAALYALLAIPFRSYLQPLLVWPQFRLVSSVPWAGIC